MSNNNLFLQVTVPADEWDRLQRRLRYLEAAIIQAYRGARRLKEWFSASELASMRLPGLPRTHQGVSRKAQHEAWHYRFVPAEGRDRCEFHFSSLPRRSFDELVERIVAPLPDMAPEDDDLPEMIDIRPAPPPPPASLVNTAPQWALPLMRLIRQEPEASIEETVQRLCNALPLNIEAPTVDEVWEFLSSLPRRR